MESGNDGEAAMKIVPIEPASTESAERVLDSLRQAMVGGDIKAFVGVGISKDHELKAWRATTSKTTNLEMRGALHTLLTCIGELD